MNVTDIVDRLGHPDRVDWDDPVVLTYGDGNVRVPRDGSYLMAAAPDLDALVALLQRTPQPTQYPAEGEPAPAADVPPEQAVENADTPPENPDAVTTGNPTSQP